MSQDWPPYKRLGSPQESSELDQMKRTRQVYKEWIWSDGLRIIKLSSRVDGLEKEMAETKGIIERILTRTEN